MTRRRQTCLIVGLAVLFTATTGIVAALPVRAQDRGEQLVERLRSRLRAAAALKADFTQTFTSEFFDETESTSGSVIIDGARYRVETGSQVFVSDGVTTWIYDRVADQVLVNDYEQDETTISLNRFLLSDDSEYSAVHSEAVVLSGAGHTAITLESTDPAAFFPECTMYIRDRDEEITRLKVVDLNGTTITFDLRNLTLNPTLSADTFTFTPALSSDVVDLRSS